MTSRTFSDSSVLQLIQPSGVFEGRVAVMQAAWSCNNKPAFVLICQDILDNLSRTCHNMCGLFVYWQIAFDFLGVTSAEIA